MKLFARMSLMGLLAAAPVAAVSAPALACGNSYRYEIDPKTNLIVKAEEALHEGQYDVAAKLAQDATGSIGKYVEGAKDPGGLGALRARGLRVAAIAAVKTDGKVDLAIPTPAQGAKTDLQANTLTWAVGQLRVLGQREPGNPYLQARLAEGLAKDAGTADEALAILAKLASDDLMPDAAAWQLLAQLQANKANAPERDKALDQCKKRAHDPSICVVKNPGET
ncbi:MAG: hypothetical protein U1F43_06935 [Myxococcota bacterium]